MERAQRLATGLRDLGIQPGDRVAVLMANCPEVLIAYNALWRAGATITPVVFLMTAQELSHVLNDSGATAVLTTDELLGTARRAAVDVPSLHHVVVAGAGDDESVTFEGLEAAGDSPIVDRTDDDLAALMYTGGTTGRARGVALTHAQLWNAGRGLWEAAHVPGVTSTLAPLPLSHAYGLIVTVAGMHADEPGLAIIQRWFNPSEWIDLCERYAVQRSALVPAMFQMLLAEPLEEHDLSALRFVGSGAAPLPLDVIAEFERRIPGCEVNEGYRCTESGAVIAANRPGHRPIGCVGG